MTCLCVVTVEPRQLVIILESRLDDFEYLVLPLLGLLQLFS